MLPRTCCPQTLGSFSLSFSFLLSHSLTLSLSCSLALSPSRSVALSLCRSLTLSLFHSRALSIGVCAFTISCTPKHNYSTPSFTLRPYVSVCLELVKFGKVLPPTLPLSLTKSHLIQKRLIMGSVSPFCSLHLFTLALSHSLLLSRSRSLCIHNQDKIHVSCRLMLFVKHYFRITLQHTAPHCNALHHTATHCTTTKTRSMEAVDSCCTSRSLP